MPDSRLKGKTGGQGVGEQAGRGEAGVIRVDVDLIPDHVAEELAAMTLECVREFLKEHGSRGF